VLEKFMPFALIKGQMIFDKGTKTTQWKRIVFSMNDSGKTGYPYEKKMKLDFYLTPYTKINSKWNKDLNIRP